MATTSSADSAGAIFLDLGLNIAQLESGFVDANRTIQQNLNRLNRERNIINLRTQVETSGFDEATQQTQILEARQRALTQQLSIQRDRVRLTEAAYRQLNNTQGATATATQEAEARFRREQASLQRLQQQIQRVTAAQSDLAVAHTAASGTAESSLINANQTIQQNLARLGRERTSVRADAQREIAGLDSISQQRQILDVRERALSRQLEIQRARTQLIETAYNELASAQGTSSTAAQNMQTRLQREQTALQRLEQQLRRVTEAQNSFTASTTTAAQNSHINANQSVQQNLNRLRQESDAISTQAQVEISGLDEATQQVQILATRQRSLNEQLDIQRARVRLVEEAHRQLTSTQGAGAAATRNMESRLQREQLALQGLQQQLQRVTEAQTELSTVSSLAGQDSLVDVNQSVQQNLNRLGRELNLTDLRAQVEIGGLDEATNQTQILSIRQRSLNTQLNIQRTRIRLVEEAHRRLSSAQGANSAAAQDMEASLQRERIALQRLEQQLQQTQQAQERLNSTSNANNVGGGNAGSSNADNTSGGGLGNLVDGVLDRIPPQAKAAAAAMAGLGAAIVAAGKASTDLIERWRELQTQAYELNISVKDTENFLREMRLAGGDIGDFEGYIRGITDAWSKGEWDDPEFLTLRKYGASIVDATGRLKNFKDITEEVYQAYKKAKAAGEEIEFLQLTGGESGIRDAIQFFERYEEAKEDAAKIATAKLDPREFHEAERALNLYNEQAQEFINSIENLITPARVATLEKLFSVFHDGTEYLVENKDAIQNWGYIAAETFDTVANKIDNFFSGESKIARFIDSWEGNTQFNRFLDQVNTDLDDTLWRRSSQKFFGDVSDELFGGIIDRAKAKQDEAALKEHIQKVLEAGQNLEHAHAKLKAQIEGAPTTQYGMQRLNDLKDEIKDINAEIANFKHGYDLELAQLNLQKERALRQNDLSKQERLAIEELYAKKRIQIEQETQDKLDDIRDEATAEFKGDLENRFIEIENTMDDWIDAGMKQAEAEALAQKLKIKAFEDALKELNDEVASIEFAQTHSDLEQELRDIEVWKQAQLEKASTAEEVAATIANAAMKEADAFEREVDRMRGKIESAQDRLARLTMSQRDNDIYQAQKRYYQDLQELPQEFADAIYQAEIDSIKKREKEDKGGSYTKRPNSEQDEDTYYRLLDFTKNNKQIEDRTKRLIMLDAEEEARTEVLKNARAGIEDIDRSVQKAKIPLMGLTGELSKAESAAEKTIQQLQGTADTTQDLGDTLENANSEVSKNANGIKNATSAADTFAEALNKSAKIQAQNTEDRLQLPQPEQSDENGRIKVHFGDDPIYGKNRIQKGVKILYGDDMSEPINLDEGDEIPALYSKFANLGDATEELTADINSANVDSLENVNNAAENTAQSLTENVNSLENVNDAAEKIAQNLAQIGNIDLQKPISDLQAAITPSAENLTAFTTALDSATEALKQAADKINGIDIKAPQAKENNDNDVVDKALDATQTSGKIVSLAGEIALLAGSVTPQTAAALAIIGGVVETLADIASQVNDFNDSDKPEKAKDTTPVDNPKTRTEDLIKELQTINQSLSPLENMGKTLDTIAQDLKSFDLIKNATADIPKDNSIIPLATENNNLPTQDFSPFQTSFDSFNSELEKSQLTISEFTVSLKDSADKINGLSFDNPQKDILSDITQIFSNGVFQQMSQDLAALSQTAGAIAQSVSTMQQQPPVINVNPNISIDLGGAYVFDDQLKSQLTDDIASEVADAITDAVSNATSGAGYGYGN